MRPIERSSCCAASMVARLPTVYVMMCQPLEQIPVNLSSTSSRLQQALENTRASNLTTICVVHGRKKILENRNKSFAKLALGIIALNYVYCGGSFVLHKVKVSFCRDHLMWVVRLQRQLLEAICDVSVCGTHVTEPWVITQLPQLDHQWVTGLCQSYKSKQKPRMTLLAYMEAMADYPPAVKTELLEAFKHDLQVLEDLERGVRPGRTMRGIQAIGNKQQQKEIRAFFELFYEPNFDKGKGYPTTTIGNQPVNFDRSHFVEQFKDENTFTAVCPLCDGQRGIAQVDHFYPKSRYPFLSCHPLNLIPICKDCNMAPCKGEKPPIAHRAQTNQMEEWFHPVLEPLADWTDSATHPNSSQFRIEFKRKNGPTAPV